VPSDIAVPIAVNAGEPVVEHAPASPASRALDRIAVSILGPDLNGDSARRRRKARKAGARA
jgi:MinD-like ATPase involved in chromosome partitioning or flagellar assembly